jgi:ABC-2 type transport system ATP-binding protein
MMSAPAVRATTLRKSYAGVVAVESLDFEVAAGGVVGFLGPNGAGKTTAIRMLSTILEPDSGSFEIGGISSAQPMAIRRLLGVLPESAGYPHGQTGQEWLAFHGRLFGRARADALGTARRLLDEVGLEERGQARIATYSRGMKQRLGIARALINDPQVVFLDEPTLGLDPSGQIQILELVTRIAHEHGVTVLISTHLLAELEQVCDQVLILNRGRVVAQGTIEEVSLLAGAARRGVVRVPPGQREKALDLLTSHGLTVDEPGNLQGGELTVMIPAAASAEQISVRTLRCLLESGIPVLAFTPMGGRLNDAFMTLTGTADE